MSAPALLFVIVTAFASYFERHLLLATAEDCPLDLTWSNFTWAASACSSQNERAKCCRYLNAFVTVSVAHYANKTGNLGIPPALNDVCISYVSQTFVSYGIPHNATLFCGVGPKIHVFYQCQGMTGLPDFLRSPKFDQVIINCKMPLATESGCRSCLNSSITYLHHLIGAQDNVTLNTCRDAAFVALAEQGDIVSAINLASCFFSIKELQILPVNASQPTSQQISPALTPSPSQHLTDFPHKEHRGAFRITLLPGIGIMVAGLAIALVIVLLLFIQKKKRKLKGAEMPSSCNAFQYSNVCNCKGPSIFFQRFNYKDLKQATNNFHNILGRGGYGTIYKAQFDCGTIASVKRMIQVAEYHKVDFYREMELLSRLHHRHLVALRGFCVQRCERFLIYEYVENGSLEDHLHSSDKTPLNWQMRIQIAIDVANALEYLHFYCEPPLCHRDIRTSNILLDRDFLAKVTDFGIAHASERDETVAELVNSYIYGTPDPESTSTSPPTTKSDVYSFGLVLLEIVTGRRAIHENRHLIEWAQPFMGAASKLLCLVDPKLGSAFDMDQLQAIVAIVKWCTQREANLRPSMKQVLTLLHASLDPLQTSFAEAVEHESKFNDSRLGDLQSSATTSVSYCSHSLLLESDSPQSPTGIVTST